MGKRGISRFSLEIPELLKEEFKILDWQSAVCFPTEPINMMKKDRKNSLNLPSKAKSVN